MNHVHALGTQQMYSRSTAVNGKQDATPNVLERCSRVGQLVHCGQSRGFFHITTSNSQENALRLPKNDTVQSRSYHKHGTYMKRQIYFSFLSDFAQAASRSTCAFAFALHHSKKIAESVNSAQRKWPTSYCASMHSKLTSREFLYLDNACCGRIRASYNRALDLFFCDSQHRRKASPSVTTRSKSKPFQNSALRCFFNFSDISESQISHPDHFHARMCLRVSCRAPAKEQQW